ncbi:class I tRNA ligase family protein, partial [Escherichia coli]|nr:class I tRNA ligase family protein [Escherichia coli]
MHERKKAQDAFSVKYRGTLDPDAQLPSILKGNGGFPLAPLGRGLQQDWCISRQLWWGHRIPAWYDEA